MGLLEQALDVFQVRGAALLSRSDDDAFAGRRRSGRAPVAEAGGCIASAGEVPAFSSGSRGQPRHSRHPR